MNSSHVMRRPTGEFPDVGRRVTTRTQIVRMLRERQNHPHELSVYIPETTYHSHIVEVTLSDLLIDMLFPKEGNKWVVQQPVAQFECLGFEEGVERTSTFRSILKECIKHEGFPLIRVALPDEVYERLERFYARPAKKEKLWVQFYLSGRLVKQNIAEISLFDARFRAKLDVRGERTIPRISIHLPDESEVICKGELVRLSQYDYSLEYEEFMEGQHLLSLYIGRRYQKSG